MMLMSGVGAASSQTATCDAKVIENLKGQYVGQQLGYRNEMEVTAVDTEACTVQSTWRVARDGNETTEGTMQLTLNGGILTGSWTAGGGSGEAKFAVRRKGQHWNGRMKGWKDQPSGPWDYIKVIKEKQL